MKEEISVTFQEEGSVKIHHCNYHLPSDGQQLENPAGTDAATHTQEFSFRGLSVPDKSQSSNPEQELPTTAQHAQPEDPLENINAFVRRGRQLRHEAIYRLCLAAIHWTARKLRGNGHGKV